MNIFPKIAVLMASYNGELWIQQQVESITNQVEVNVDIYISIDKSTDQTLHIIKILQNKYPNLILLNYGSIFGSAKINFYRLIEEVDFSLYEYVSLADQDDIWLPEKLSHAIKKLKLENCDAYSSDVIAVWENGRSKIIRKSYPQKKFDYIFESAGPGSTYLFKKYIIDELKNIILKEKNVLVVEHDWFIYAYCRSEGYKWFIDQNSLIYYRQHLNNLYGANITIKSYIQRLIMLRNGWYFNQVSTISRILNYKIPTRLFIIKNFLQLRRSKRDAFILLILNIFLWLKI